MSQPLIRLNDNPDAPIMHIAVANGFPPETYIPLLRPFFESYQVVCLPPRALWGDQNPPKELHDWTMLADDLQQGIEDFDLNNILAIGHSFGGVASLLSAIQQPQRFRALILLDPTMLPPHMLEMIRTAQEQGVIEQSPLAQSAARRRTHFDSADEFYDRLRNKKHFANWSDETLRLYANGGTLPDGNGGGVTLRWSADWEKYYYCTMRTKIWDDVPKVKNLLPTLIIRGGTTDTYVAESAEAVEKILPEATHKVIEGHGHLFPQSAPKQTAKLIQDWLHSKNLC